MAEVPEHLLRRSRERRKALGLPVPGEEGETAEAAAEAPADEAPAAEAPAADAGGEAAAAEARPTGDASSKIPAHLLARSAARRGKEGAAAPAAGGANIV
ncbi:MAG: hypothetical protein ACRDZ3_23205, partial [Acidimicrobiia bacterium]